MRVVPGIGPLDPGRQKGLVPAVELHAVPTRHQLRLGQRGPVPNVRRGAQFPLFQLGQGPHRGAPAALDVAHRKTEQQMGRPEIGDHVVGVHLLVGGVGVRQFALLGPGDQVVGDGRADGANSGRFPVLGFGHPSGKIPPVGAVFFNRRVPEPNIGRIEGAVGNHRLVMRSLPVDAVGRGKQRHPSGRRLQSPERLQTLPLRAARPAGRQRG